PGGGLLAHAQHVAAAKQATENAHKVRCALRLEQHLIVNFENHGNVRVGDRVVDLFGIELADVGVVVAGWDAIPIVRRTTDWTAGRAAIVTAVVARTAATGGADRG